MGFKNLYIDDKEKTAVVCLYFSRLDSEDPFYKENRTDYYKALEKSFGIKYNTIKNNQDRFDPYYENGRKGWHQKPLQEQHKFLYEVFEKYKDVPTEQLRNIVDWIMDDISKGESMFYSIKTKTPAAVEAIKQKQQSVEIDRINIFREDLKIGQLVFIVLGGDKQKSEVTWDTGFIGIGKIVEGPYDIGYDKNNFKIKISVEVLLDKPIARHDLIPYSNAYNIIGIGPMTKWEPNQAISQIEENKVVTLVRAVLDLYENLEEELEEVFDPGFMSKVKAETQYLVPQIKAYGSWSGWQEGPEEYSAKELPEKKKLTSTYDPDINIIKGPLEMDSSVLETFRNYINIKKHIIMTGPPGTGKTTIAERACEEAVKTNFINGYILTTATADWSTFDTIGGYMPNKEGRLEFQEGIILRSIRENKWLIIDEINRAEIDKAFGHLLTVLSGKDVQLPFKFGDSDESISIKIHNELESYFDEENAVYYIGSNWRIISTMNTFDKNSLFTLSYAFMRRFAFVYIPIPSLKYMNALIDSSSIKEQVKEAVKNVCKISPKPIGPAVIQDLVNYLTITDSRGLEDAVCALVIPQYEGLANREVKDFYKNMYIYLKEESRVKFKEYLSEFFEISRNEFNKIDKEIKEENSEEETKE